MGLQQDSFRIQIKRLDFRLPRGKRKNLCGHKRPQPATLFIVLGREVKDAVDPSHCCCDINRFTNSHRLYMN